MNEKTREAKFYSIGCKTCGGLQLGGDENGLESIPIFRTVALAQIALADWQDEEERVEHPARIIEIIVRIV